MLKKVLVGLGVIILVVALAGGSFYAGMLFQRAQASRIQADFFADRGGAPGPGGAGGVGGPGGGAVGQITRIDGDTLTLSTQQSEVTVSLTDTTRIEKTVAGERGDLQPGDTIVVRGERDSAGNVVAEDIQITTGIPGLGQ
jgi:hypothetical protein